MKCYACKRDRKFCNSCFAGMVKRVRESHEINRRRRDGVQSVNVKRKTHGYRSSPLYHIRFAARFLGRALAHAKAAGADIHFQSEIDHLIATANHNIEELQGGVAK